MSKVYNLSEIPRVNRLMMDCYQVRFWFHPEGGFSAQATRVYYTEGKGAHKAVEARWRKDFEGKKVDLISIKYI